MSTEVEGKFKVAGASLYSKTWTPTVPIVAKLVFVHGFNEHINRYNEFFPRLTAHGIQVLAWDQRGWGRSVTKPSERGLSGDTALILEDISAFIKDALSKAPLDVPVFVMGHSLGGGEIIFLASDPKYADLLRQVRGWVLECPLAGFTEEGEPNPVTVFLGRLVGRLLPNRQMKHIVPPEYLSRDPAIAESVKNDPLCHNTGTLRGLAASLDRTMAIRAGEAKLDAAVQSVLLAHGTGDKICSYDAAAGWLKQQGAADKSIKTYDGAYHQLHSDHCKDDFAKDLVSWMLERSKVTSQADSKL